MPRRSASSLSVVPIASRAARLRPPPTLSESERAIFIDIVAACDANHFRASDLPLLCRYAEACALAEQAAQELRQGGAVIGGRPSPWIMVQEKANRTIVALSMRLRLSPQSRAPNNPSRKPPTSAYDRMRIETDDEA